jgi:nitrite reductase/ring-hydroxylating ferredoxin subunit
LNEVKLVTIEGYPILIFKAEEGRELAYLNGCPHKRRPLVVDGSADVREGRYIRCQFHGAVFDLSTGELVVPPQSKTPCPENCRLVRAVVDGNKVEFEGEPFIPQLPERK